MKKIINIIIITILFFILLNLFFGAGGWLTKGWAYIATLMLDYENIDDASGYSGVIALSTNDNQDFLMYYGGLLSSDQEHCYKRLHFVQAVEGTSYKLRKKGNDVQAQFVDKDGNVNANYLFKDTQPCAVYTKPKVTTFIKHTKCEICNGKKGQDLKDCITDCRKDTAAEYQTYSSLEVTKPTKALGVKLASRQISMDNTKEGFEWFLLYKPDKDHVCFIPNNEFITGNGKTCEPGDVIDPDCFDTIKYGFIECDDPPIVQNVALNGGTMVGPTQWCAGNAVMPSGEFASRINQKAWNSNGMTYGQIAIQAANENKVDPGLLVAQMVVESNMGKKNSCTQEGKSSLTGCGWSESSCSFADKPAFTSDLTQVQCTGNVISKALKFKGSYENCAGYQSNADLFWKCVLCTYQGDYEEIVSGSKSKKSFKKDKTCKYANDVKNEYCSWHNYFQNTLPQQNP